MTTQQDPHSLARVALLNPEDFESLPKRTQLDRQLCLWRFPSFGPCTSWTIFSPNADERAKINKSYVVRRIESEPRSHTLYLDGLNTYGSEGIISPELANHIIDSFEALQIPLFRKLTRVGIDGETYGVHKGDAWQNTCIEWHSNLNKEWQPLESLFEETVLVLESALPASTLREIYR